METVRNPKVGEVYVCTTDSYARSFPLGARIKILKVHRSGHVDMEVESTGEMFYLWNLWQEEFSLFAETPITPEEAARAKPLPTAEEAEAFMRRLDS